MDSGEHKHNSTFNKLLIPSTSPPTPQTRMSPTLLSENNLGGLLLLTVHSVLPGFAGLEDEASKQTVNEAWKATEWRQTSASSKGWEI